MRIDEFDWTNLIILDAARHDLYEEVNGPTQKRRTVGSSSEDFIRKTFTSGDWSDTVVVTANPHYHPELFEEEVGQKPGEVFKEVYRVYRDGEKWSEEEGTVKPEQMLQAVHEATQDYPRQHREERGFIIHMMQPHTPFIDSTVTQDSERDMNVWDRLEEDEYIDQEVWTAYKNNLEKVMPYTKKIDDLLIGPTAVTADHGNAFGENGEYGHPSGSKNPVLRQVPLDYLWPV